MTTQKEPHPRMILKLKGLEVECIIGERPEERHVPQALRIDIELEVPDHASKTDEIADAVDYAVLAESVRDALVSAKCHLIERAAKVALEICISDTRISAAKVSVTKHGAVPGLESATAVAEFRRQT